VNELDIKTWITVGEDVSMEEYCRNMKKSNSWGGGIEIIAAVLLYDVIIEVILNQNAIIFGEQVVNDKSRRIKLGYNGSHYVPIFN
jgi:hypothetical protein